MVLYALKLGAVGFGGPVALVGYMHRDLVEDRKWLTEKDYKEGLTLAQLMPGPLAAQLAIYLGYCHYGVPGATLVGVAFVVPSFLMVVAISWGYVRLGGMAWMQAVFYAVGACIIGIIALSAQKLTLKTIGKDRLLWVIYLSLAAVTFLTEQESIPLIVLAGLVVWLIQTPPRRIERKQTWQIAVAIVGAIAAVCILYATFIYRTGTARSAQTVAHAATNSSGVLWQILWFFTKAGAFVFGSGLAIVPFLFGGVVKQFHWLNDHQFLDAVAVAMITPGPVVITTAFIGYLVAGFPGACIAAVATFFPCYIFTVVPAPIMRRHGTTPAVVALVNGVTAAATGAITGAVIVLGKRSIVDLPTSFIALAAYLVLWKSKRVPEPALIAVAALLGLALYPLVNK